MFRSLFIMTNPLFLRASIFHFATRKESWPLTNKKPVLRYYTPFPNFPLHQSSPNNIPGFYRMPSRMIQTPILFPYLLQSIPLYSTVDTTPALQMK